MQLTDPVKTVKGVGEKSAQLLEKLNIVTVEDLIRHYPRNYDDFELPIKINEAAEGRIVTVEGAVSRVTSMPNRRKKVVTCYVSDPTGALKLVWFNQQYIVKLLKPGYRLIFRGTVKRDNAELAIYQPKNYLKNDYVKLLGSLQPIYDLTKGITSNFISKAVKQALTEISIDDPLPAAFRKENYLPRLSDAIKTIHFPKNKQEALYARRRLVFEEFLDLNLFDILNDQ